MKDFELQQIEQHRYEPVGTCIYCMKTGGTLTDEHIVPYALGGRLVLPRASCEKCAAITSRLETNVLRGGLRGIKERLSLSTRSKQRPKHLQLFCVNGDERRKVQVAIEDYPAVAIFPHFAGPQIATFSGASASEETPWFFVPPFDLKTLREKYGVTSWASNSMDTFSFARMLAKIAHALTVAQYGLRSFVPFLPDVILRNEGLLFLRFIGTVAGEGKLEEGPVFHRLRGLVEEADGRRFLTCHIQLLANFGSPTYRVVAGQLLDHFDPLMPLPSSRIVSDERMADWRLVLSTEEVSGRPWFAIPRTPIWVDETSGA